MWAYLLFAIGTIFVMTLSNATSQSISSLENLAYQQDRDKLTTLSVALDNYLKKVNISVPSTLNDFINTPGFEHLQQLDLTNVGYATTQLSDNRLTFDKAIFFIKTRSSGLSDTDFLGSAGNGCGNASFFDSDIFCKNDGSLWHTADNRGNINDIIVDTTRQLDRLLQKFADGYRVNGVFVSQTKSGVAINNNSSASLADITGYTSTAKNCSGMFFNEGVFFGCVDLFDGLGNDILLFKHTDKFISVISQLSLNDNNGSPLVFSRNLEII